MTLTFNLRSETLGCTTIRIVESFCQYDIWPASEALTIIKPVNNYLFPKIILCLCLSIPKCHDLSEGVASEDIRRVPHLQELLLEDKVRLEKWPYYHRAFTLQKQNDNLTSLWKSSLGEKDWNRTARRSREGERLSRLHWGPWKLELIKCTPKYPHVHSRLHLKWHTRIKAIFSGTIRI